VVPHQLAYLVYEPLRQNLFAAGLVLLGLSIVLGLALVFNLRRSLVLGVHLAAGMALLVMAVILFSSGSPFIALSLVLFGLFSGLTPLLEPPRVRAATPWGDLFLLAAGVIALANGVLLLLRPGALTTPVLEIDLRWERTFGLLFLLMGAALAGLQMWPDLRRRLGRWPIRLAPVLGLAYLAFFASAVVPERFGLAGVIYLFLGAALLCSPFWRRAASLMDDTSLRSRLGMALALATGVPLILTVTMISNLEEQLSRQNALSMAEGHAMGLADSVSAYIRLHRAGLSLLAGTEGLMDMPRSRQERLLAEFAAAYPDATAFSIYSVDGEVLATTNRLLAIPLRGSPVFQSLRQDRQAAIEELVSPIIRRPVLRFYHPVLDSQGRLIGAATATLLTERISNMLRDQSHLSGPVFYLVDSSGRLLAHPDMQQTARLSDLSDTPPVQAFLTGQSRTRSYYNPGGREGGWLVTYTRLPETGYGLVGEQPVSEALLSFHTGRDLALGVLLIFLLIVSFVGTLLARRLAVPLNALAAAADALAAGNYQAPVPSSEVREMNRLARSFELMRDRLLARTAEREQAQRALEEQRRLLQTTLDQAASGIAVIDTGGRIIFANRALLALAGLPPDTRLPLEPYIWGQAYDAEGRPVPPDEWVYRRALRGETVLDNEVRIEPPDGSSYNVLINASPMLDADGEVQGVVMVFNDITARKAAEEALRQANELLEERVAARTAELSLAASRMETVLRSLPVAVWITDENGRMVEVNSSVPLVWGEDAPMAENVEDYRRFSAWWPDTGQPLKPEEWPLARALRGETIVGEVIDIQRFDGRRATLITGSAPILDPEGRITGAVAVAQDITRQRELEEVANRAAREARRWAMETEAVFNSIGDAVLVYDQYGVVRQVNPGAVRICGFNPVGLSVVQVSDRLRLYENYPLPEEDPPYIKALQGEAVVNQRVTFNHPEAGDRTLLISASPIYLGEEITGAVAVWRDVTEHELLVEEHRRQSELLERLLREAPAAIAFLEGPEYRFTYANESYRRLTRGMGELIGRSVFEVWAESAELLKPQFEQFSASGQPFHVENQPLLVRRGEGSAPVEENYFTYTLTPVRGTGGQTGVMILALDTTDAVRAGQAVEAERARLRALIDNAPTGIVFVDPRGRLALANRAAASIFERELPDPLFGGQEESPLAYHPDGSPYRPEEILSAWAGKDGQVVQNVNLVIRTPGGTLKEVLVNAAPVPDPDGQPAGGVVILQDISELRQAERLARESAARERARVSELQALMDAVPASVWITYDPNASQVVGNRAVYDLLGVEYGANLHGGALPGQAAYRLNGGQAPEGELPLVTAVRTGRELKGVEMDVVDAQGRTYHMYGNVTPLLDDEGLPRGAMGAFIDITGLKNAQNAAQAYAEQLARSNRELEQFAYTASHDLQEPLRKINFFASRLKNQMAGSLDEQEGDFLNRMVSASQRMQDMIEALLTYSRVSTKAQPFVPVNLEQVARDVISDLEVSLTRSKGRVELGELPALEGDRTQLGQLLQNLIGNAIKFHRPGVPPVVRVWGEVETRGGRSWVLLRVADNGIGFEEKYLQRIFEPFERLHGRSEYEGSGMGLAICRKIVQRHGGEITAESRVGEGTTFLVALPQVHLDEQEAERTEERQK